eukprot:1964726-Rhodomonas_salina.4
MSCHHAPTDGHGPVPFTQTSVAVNTIRRITVSKSRTDSELGLGGQEAEHGHAVQVSRQGVAARRAEQVREVQDRRGIVAPETLFRVQPGPHAALMITRNTHHKPLGVALIAIHSHSHIEVPCPSRR